MTVEQITIEASIIIARMTTAELCGILMEQGKISAEAAAIRGWAMDELERRNPAAFNLWLDCTDPVQFEQVDKFFI
jgi:translation initiation factor 6 (eIF-6)